MKNILKARWISSLAFLILLFLVTGIAAPKFLAYTNIINCFNSAAMYTLLAIGIAFVIMTGEIDVSIGATLGLTAAITGLIAQRGGSILEMLAVCAAVGVVVGLVNGIGVAWFGVPSLIFTLGTNALIRGLIYIVTAGRTVENFGGELVIAAFLLRKALQIQALPVLVRGVTIVSEVAEKEGGVGVGFCVHCHLCLVVAGLRDQFRWKIKEKVCFFQSRLLRLGSVLFA